MKRAILLQTAATDSKNFAYSVLTPEGEILKQGCLGQQMRPKKHHFEERR